MSRYIYIYRGPATPMDQMTPEKMETERQAWQNWMEKAGPAMVEFGSPFAQSCAIKDDGTETSSLDLTGYSIIEAENLEAAKAISDGHPFLAEGKGRFTMEIFELIDMNK